jgi:hypothetical protein
VLLLLAGVHGLDLVHGLAGGDDDRVEFIEQRDAAFCTRVSMGSKASGFMFPNPQPAGEATEARRLVLDISDALAVLAHANYKVGVVPRRSTHAAGCEGWQEAAACLPLSSLILERMGHGRMPPGVTVVARRWGGHVAILDQV